MSGLVDYFQDFFPRPVTENLNYECDLATAAATARVQESSSSETVITKPLEELADSNADGGNTAADPPSTTAQAWKVEYMAKPLSFREWREWNKESLKIYFERRLGKLPTLESGQGQPQESQTAATETEEEDFDDDYDVYSDDEVMEDQTNPTQPLTHATEDADAMHLESQDPTSQLLTTQQDIPTSLTGDEPNAATQEKQQQPSRSKKNSKRRYRKRIPALIEAIHPIQSLEHMDMWTSDLSLDICRVTKVWRLRDTKRAQQWPGGTASTIDAPHLPQNDPSSTLARYCPVFPGRMPRIAFGNMQDDGPLATTYRYVVSLEVEQLVLPDTSTPSYPKQARVAPTKMRMFLYNNYAKAIWEWLELHPSAGAASVSEVLPSQPILLRLSQIPPLCIFPYAKDPKDWLDQVEVADYCVCIGDNSSIKVTLEDESVTPMRLDSPELELRFAVTKSTATGTAASTSPINTRDELVLSSDAVSSDGPVEHKSEDARRSLTDLWGEYAKAHQATQSTPVANASRTSNVHFTAAAAPTRTAGASIESGPPSSPAKRKRPPPPPPYKLRNSPESMDFEGPARKRTVHDNRNRYKDKRPPAPAEYANLASLKGVYGGAKENALRAHGPSYYENSIMVNVYGVVICFTCPTQTKRGDWMMTTNVIDESRTEPTTVVIFTRHVSQLPKLCKTGDVLRIHRAFLQEWNGQVQLMGKKLTSMVVVRRRSATGTSSEEANCSWVVQPTATHEYNFEGSDEVRSQTLWRWGQRLLQEQPTIMIERKLSLGDIEKIPLGDDSLMNPQMLNPEQQERLRQETRDRDLTVLVTAIVPYPTGTQSCINARGFLRVWDGTGGSSNDPWPVSTAPVGGQQFPFPDKEAGDPPQEAVAHVASVIQSLNQRARKRNRSGAKDIMDIPKVLCGKVANVVNWEATHWDLIEQHVTVGSFLRLRNVEVRQWKMDSYRCKLLHLQSSYTSCALRIIC